MLTFDLVLALPLSVSSSLSRLRYLITGKNELVCAVVNILCLWWTDTDVWCAVALLLLSVDRHLKHRSEISC